MLVRFINQKRKGEKIIMWIAKFRTPRYTCDLYNPMGEWTYSHDFLTLFVDDCSDEDIVKYIKKFEKKQGCRIVEFKRINSNLTEKQINFMIKHCLVTNAYNYMSYNRKQASEIIGEIIGAWEVERKEKYEDMEFYPDCGHDAWS